LYDVIVFFCGAWEKCCAPGLENRTRNGRERACS